MNLRNLITGIALSLLIASTSAFAAAGPQMSYSSLQGSGNPASATGVVRTSAGVPIGTTGFTAELWGSTVNDANAFQFVTGATSSFTAAVFNPSLFGGQIVEGVVSVNANFGDTFFYQVRVWDNKGGTITSFAQAQASGSTEFGASAVASRVLPADSTGQPPTIANFTSFNLQAVPEPSVLALGLVGGLVLFMRRRK